MITAIPGGVPIPVEGIENGAIVNDDGHGWALATTDGLIVVDKSMKFQTALDGLIEARKEYGQSSVALFHSRFATHGTTNEDNIHPFWVGEYSVVAHNGVLPSTWWPGKKDDRSDTRVFAEETAPSYLSEATGIPSRRGAKEIGKRIGMGNKLVFLSVASGRPAVRIVNAHAGTHKWGAWFSNDGFEPSTYRWWNKWDNAHYSTSYYKGGSTVNRRTGNYYDTACEFCGAIGFIESDSGWCEMCETCQVCFNVTEHCTCPWNQTVIGAGRPAIEETPEAAAARILREYDDDLDYGPVCGEY
jgi:glutamine amidotransferase